LKWLVTLTTVLRYRAACDNALAYLQTARQTKKRQTKNSNEFCFVVLRQYTSTSFFGLGTKLAYL